MVPRAGEAFHRSPGTLISVTPSCNARSTTTGLMPIHADPDRSRHAPPSGAIAEKLISDKQRASVPNPLQHKLSCLRPISHPRFISVRGAVVWSAVDTGRQWARLTQGLPGWPSTPEAPFPAAPPEPEPLACRRVQRKRQPYRRHIRKPLSIGAFRPLLRQPDRLLFVGP